MIYDPDRTSDDRLADRADVGWVVREGDDDRRSSPRDDRR